MAYTKLYRLNDEKQSDSYENIIKKIDNKKFTEDDIKTIFSTKDVDYEINKKEENQEIKFKSNIKLIFTIYELKLIDTVSYKENKYQLIIIKDKDDKVYFIVSHIISKSKTLIRKILDYTDKNMIQDVLAEDYKLLSKNHFIYWILNKIFKYNIDINEDFLVNSITKLQGKTTLFNKVSTEGSEVTNMLTTLAFLLESNHLSNLTIKLDSTNGDHIGIIVALRKYNSDYNLGIEVNTEEYTGIYQEDDYLDIKLLLLIYWEILPSIKFEYNASEIDSEDSEEKKFIEYIKNNLLKKLENI